MYNINWFLLYCKTIPKKYLKVHTDKKHKYFTYIKVTQIYFFEQPVDSSKLNIEINKYRKHRVQNSKTSEGRTWF